MADRETLRTTFERNARALEMRPSVGKSTAVAKITVTDGTTCHVDASGSVEPYSVEDGYDIPGEYVVACGWKGAAEV